MIEAFAAAIDWSEPFVVCILAMHSFLYGIALCSLRYGLEKVQLTLWIASLALAALSQRLNTVASHHWQRFATQNYFDERGVFSLVFWGAPFLSLALLMVFAFLYRAAVTLIALKRCELAEQRKQSKSKEE
jgi:transmembrane protein 18